MNTESQRIARRDKKTFLSVKNNANKWRKTVEWERREISSRKLEISREHFMQDGHNKGQTVKTLEKQMRLSRSGKNTLKNYSKKTIMTWITPRVWSLTYSQTSWSVMSSGPYEALLQTKQVEVVEFQLNYFKS